MMAPGSVVEPGTIKRFKSRLNDGHIVEVSEQNFDKWDKYFRERIGVTIAATGGVVAKAPICDAAPVEPPKESTKAKAKPKMVAKVTSK